VSDQHESGSLPELTPGQEETVRRLLAQARHEEPMPAEVGERLDRVLADLSLHPLDRSATVVDLAARRRRRNATGLLVAAAAVIVGGFMVGQVIDVGGSDSASDSGADSAVARDQSAGGQALRSSGAAGDAQEDAAPEAATKAEPLQLTSENLQRDIERQLKQGGTAANLDAAPQHLSPSYAVEYSCAPASPSAYGDGALFPAFYDGVPTVLALRPVTGGSQEAQVLECGTGTTVRSVTVPAR
jgi:hypothetical protein